MISKEQLLQEAKTSYYKPEILEKVYRLLSALEQFMSVPYLQKRLVLKGCSLSFNKMPIRHTEVTACICNLFSDDSCRSNEFNYSKY